QLRHGADDARHRLRQAARPGRGRGAGAQDAVTMYGDRSAPPLGRLIGNALQHWADHQRVFWLVAGFCGLLFGALRLAEMRGWLGSSSSQSTTFVFLVYVLFLYLAIHL